MNRIGIDFGNTIGKIEEEPNQATFNIIRMLIAKYSADNIFIVSRAGKEMQPRILDWLNQNKFFELTGFSRENVLFVLEYDEKRIVVEKLKLNIFIDDHTKIIRSLVELPCVQHVVWFNTKADINLIDKQYRNKIIISTNWNKIWSHQWNS